MNRRALVLVICAFLLTRGFMLLQLDSNLYRSASSPDVPTYERWTEEIEGLQNAPYRDVDIEYPPGVLPIVLAPSYFPGDYRSAFIGLMFLIDAAGLFALLRIARRTGCLHGAFAWTFGLLLLGPVAYLRLDLAPAVATIWAIEAPDRESWRNAGSWWGFAIMAKLYPLLLLPAVALKSSKPSRLLLAAAATIGIFLLSVPSSLGYIWNDVVGYHAGRGLQIESTWATVLRIADHVPLRATGGAIEVASAWAPTLKVVGLVLSVLTFAWGTLVIKRAALKDLHAGLYGMLALILGVGTVLSPQFLIWLLALAAAALAFHNERFKRPLFAVLPIVFLTQLVYPTMYEGLKQGDFLPLMVIGARNLGLIGVGVWVLLTLRRRLDTHTLTTPN
jgi:hypothetical protein